MEHSTLAERRYTKLQVSVTAARLRDLKVDIFRPVFELGRLFASPEPSRHGMWYVNGDAAALRRLAKLVAISARFKDVIVHVPLTGSPLRPYFMDKQFVPHDIVFCHHSLQMRASSWKAMSTLRSPRRVRNLSVSIPVVDIPRSPKDLLDVAVHSNTIIISGSQPILAYLADMVNAVSTCTRTGDCAEPYDEVRNKRHGIINYVKPKDWRSAE